MRAGLVSGLVSVVLYSNFQFPLHVEATAAHFWLFAGMVSAVDASGLPGGGFRTVFDFRRGAMRRGSFAELPLHFIFAATLFLCFMYLGAVAAKPLWGSLLFARGMRIEGAKAAPETAMRLLVSGFKEYPHDPDICGEMASSLFRRGREAVRADERSFYVSRAMPVLKTCMRMKPLDVRLLNVLGRHYLETGDGAEAVKAYEKSVNINPMSHEAFYNLGIAYSFNGRYNDAARALGRCLELNAGFVPAYLNLGNALKRLGRADEAVAAYRKALEIGGGSPLIRATLGALLTDEGRFDEAEAQFREAMKASPMQPEAAGNFAILLHKRGRDAEAEKLLLGVLDMPGGGRSAVVALYHLGDIYEKTGRRGEAVSAWRRALRLAPNSPVIQDRLSEVSH